MPDVNVTWTPTEIIIKTILYRTMFLRQKTVKQVFPKRSNEKILPMFDDYPFCLSRSLQGSFHPFCMGIEMIKIFSFK